MKFPNWIENLLYLWSKAIFVRSITKDHTSEFNGVIHAAVVDIEAYAANVIDLRHAETKFIQARLMRLFDPGPAFNEAIIRAIEAKKAAKEHYMPLSGFQEAALEVQRKTTTDALRNA